MKWDDVCRSSPRLQGLLGRARYFKRLDGEIKRILPANLSGHFRVACVDESGRLVLFVSSNMAATRLKMLLPAVLPAMRELDIQIQDVVCRVIPNDIPPPREKHFYIPQCALDRFDETAQMVAHHRDLSHALQQLVQHHRKHNG